MKKIHEAEMRMRTAELSLVQARRRKAALKLLPVPTNRQDLVDRMWLHADVADAERRASAERARAVRARYLPELVA